MNDTQQQTESLASKGIPETSVTVLSYWPNVLFAVLFVGFVSNILHLYETEENTTWLLRSLPLPLGCTGIVAFIAALIHSIKRDRTVMALLVVPFGLFLVAYMWMLAAPMFS